MKDSQDKTIEFAIDIERFNEVIRRFMALHLKEVWGAAQERLEQFRIYMAIRECECRETGARKELQDAILYVQPDSPAENGKCIHIELCEEDGDRDGNGTCEKCRERVEHEMRRWIKEDAPMGWGGKLTCGAAVNLGALPSIVLAGEFEILWAVCDKVEDNSPISRLVRSVILKLLENGFRDIDQIRALQYFEYPEKELKEYAGFRDFDFMVDYVDHVIDKYQLPDKKECEKLSLSSYEKRACKGKIILLDEAEFCRDRQGKVFIEKRKGKYHRFSEIEYTRKMLEACCRRNYLVVGKSAEHEILGYACDEDTPKHTVIEYQDSARWKVRAEGEEVLCYKRGAYYISNNEHDHKCQSKLEKIKEAMLKDNAAMKELAELGQREIYQSIEALSTSECAALINELSVTVEHGALLIIAQDADHEVDRLCLKFGRGTKIVQDSPDSGKEFPEGMISGLASIDGAVFMDFTGKYLAFGVILDGEAKVEGRSDKGSRYNSAANYIADKNRIAVVISEDKEKETEILYCKAKKRGGPKASHCHFRRFCV